MLAKIEELESTAYNNAMQRVAISSWVSLNITGDTIPYAKMNLALTNSLMTDRFIAATTVYILSNNSRGLLHLDLDTFTDEQIPIVMELATGDTIQDILDKAWERLPTTEKAMDGYIEQLEGFTAHLNATGTKGDLLDLNVMAEKFAEKARSLC